MALTIMSLNYKGNGQTPKTKGLKVTEMRKKLVTSIIKDKKPDIILIQEPSIKISKIFPEQYMHLAYDASQNEEAGILYNTSTLIRVKGFEDINIMLKELRDKMVNNSILTDADELIPRIRAEILESKGQVKIPFLCISYHGPKNRRNVQARINMINAALKLLNYVQKYFEFPLPVIFGGDFNVDIEINLSQETWEKLSPADYRHAETIYHGVLMSVVPYLPTGRRAHIYDFLLVSDGIYMQTPEAIDIFKYIKKEAVGDDDKVVLDHDPLVARFEINDEIPFLKTLSPGDPILLWKLEGSKDKRDGINMVSDKNKRLMW